MKQHFNYYLLALSFLFLSIISNAQLKWVDVAAGNLYTLAIKSDGTLWAWGYNGYGNLGTGDTIHRPIPVRVGLENNWLTVRAGGGFTLALKKDGTLWTWGNNSLGQLGTGNYTEQHSPVKVGTDKWLKIAVGDTHSLGIKADGTLWAWGSNFSGELGVPSFPITKSPTPLLVNGNQWIDLAGATQRTMALRGDGTIWGWGWNIDGELGNGNTLPQTQAVQAGSANDWKSISAGGFTTCAIKNDGTLWSWGWNLFGDLGIGNNIDKHSPVMVGTDNTWTAVSVGGGQTLAIKGDGTLWGWGYNYYGEIGVGDKLMRNAPVLINFSNSIVNVYTGYAESAVLDINKDKICMAGSNSNWQLGDSTTVDKYLFECGKYLQSVLSASIISIKAYEINNQIHVSWDVAAETNILKYDIEKSYNGIDFQKIGSISAKNNYNSSASYSWTDVTSQKGNNFYRIKIVEKSGDEKLTSIVNLKIGFSKVGISCYPNPISGNSINLYLENLPNGNYSISLLNAAGQRMLFKTIQYSGLSSYQSLNITNTLPKGLYHLFVTNEANRYSLPIIIN